MGVLHEDLVQRLIDLDEKCSLQDIVSTCRSFEASRRTATAIKSTLTHTRAVSQYKKNKAHANQSPTSIRPINKATSSVTVAHVNTRPTSVLQPRAHLATAENKAIGHARRGVLLSKPNAASVTAWGIMTNAAEPVKNKANNHV
ncbi:hypothetical protein Pcinc_000106 [Petrolisthes cinctipes]|uniref:Uncharacterized protein n=1 Tax=Petrolisthes cinctipes TaxID=88211 RepID=A0AAE1L4B6_PETCI|nr:hypothetical protein Pcinc_000106 [Petrolisthes cinctipes]